MLRSLCILRVLRSFRVGVLITGINPRTPSIGNLLQELIPRTTAIGHELPEIAPAGHPFGNELPEIIPKQLILVGNYLGAKGRPLTFFPSSEVVSLVIKVRSVTQV